MLFFVISLPEDVQSEASDANINKRILKEKDDEEVDPEALCLVGH